MRLIMPATIVAEYRITTPMFLGDAQQQSEAGQVRTASIKGALRFWWRALYWGPLLSANAGEEAMALQALHAEEGALFGRASDGRNSVQSLVQINAELSDAQWQPQGQPMRDLAYLLGLGLWSGKSTSRSHIAGGMLRLTLRLKPSVSGAQAESVRRAMMALGLFGGLGSRARRGLGSLSLQWIEYAGQRTEIKDLSALRGFVADLDLSASASAPLSAFSAASRLLVVTAERNPRSALAQAGELLQLYRDGTVGGKTRQSNFANDRLLAGQAARGDEVGSLPQRATFGLPHNYFWKDTKAKLDIAPKDSERNRRASPLLTHVHQFPDGSCVVIYTLLATRFLPQGTQVELKGRSRQHLEVSKMDYQVIHTFLDGLDNAEELRREA